MVQALILLLSACAPESTEAERFLEALHGEHPPEVAAGICQGLTRESAQGDCLLAVAVRAGDPALCQTIGSEIWRWECYFQQAEGALRRGERDRAVAHCAQAGELQDDCAQHLWQTALHRLALVPGALEGSLEDSSELFRAWSPLLEDSTDFKQRFWSRYFRERFQHQSLPLQLARCDALGEELQETCWTEGLQIAGHRLRDRCAAETRRAALESPEHPRLQGLIESSCSPQAPPQGKNFKRLHRDQRGQETQMRQQYGK